MLKRFFFLMCTAAKCASEPELGAARKVIYDHFDASCSVHLDAAPGSLFLDAPVKRLRTANSTRITRKLNNSEMLLCQHVPVDGIATATKGRFAVVTTTDKISYVARPDILKYSNMSQWGALQSKVDYARTHDMPMFVVIGSLDQIQRPFRSPTCPQGLKIKHIGLKVLGLLAVFVLKPDVAGLLYADVDAAIIDFSVTPHDYLALSAQAQKPRVFKPSPTTLLILAADFIATGNWRMPVLANGGVLLFRNTQRSMQLLSKWWGYRCSKHDQPALWRSMYEQWPGWKSSALNNRSAQEQFWSEAHTNTLHHFSHNHHELRVESRLSTPWTCGGVCGWLYKATGCLTELLEMPGVLLLPTTPFRVHRQFRALQHHSGLLYSDRTDQWICHVDNMAGKTCAPAPSNKSAVELSQQRQDRYCADCTLAILTLRKTGCIKHSTDTNYQCSCEKMVLPKYEIYENSSKVIAHCPGCSANGGSRHYTIHTTTQHQKGYRKLDLPQKGKR